MKITFASPELPDTGVLVVGVLRDNKLTPSARALDQRTKGAVVRAIKASRFEGRKAQSLHLPAPAGTKLEKALMVGLGKVALIDPLVMQAVGGQIFAALAPTGLTAASVAVDPVPKAELSAPEMAAHIAHGTRLRSYRFDKYRTKQEAKDKPSLKALRVLVESPGKARTTYAPLDKVADGVFLTRDLVSEPANVIYPETLARQARGLTHLGVKVEVLGEARMRALGMNSLLGVGQGSARESKLVVMRWTGASGRRAGGRRRRAEGPVAFIGKGVTFDTGGISIKPSAGMEDMKWDMGGAGVVIGLMRALAGRKSAVDAVGVIGLVENMPGSNAQRPGDIVTSMSGQTIEVINTDAEGRLVLADALWYCKERFKPRLMVDLATLTGAIIVCLGHEKAGLFSTNDQLAERLTLAGSRVNEPLWRLPLGDEYDQQINSDAADMKNVGSGRGAGSITAAQFLKRFVGDTPWAHLDIAGVAWAKKDKATVPKGGTGFGVRLLDRLVADHYEAS